MTVETTTNISTALGNDTATSFPFDMIIAEDTEITVVKTDASGNETTLTEGTGSTNFSVSVAKYPGKGSIIYPASGSTKLATGEKLFIRRVKSLKQEMALSNQGGYFPSFKKALSTS